MKLKLIKTPSNPYFTRASVELEFCERLNIDSTNNYISRHVFVQRIIYLTHWSAKGENGGQFLIKVIYIGTRRLKNCEVDTPIFQFSLSKIIMTGIISKNYEELFLRF